MAELWVAQAGPEIESQLRVKQPTLGQQFSHPCSLLLIFDSRKPVRSLVDHCDIGKVTITKQTTTALNKQQSLLWKRGEANSQGYCVIKLKCLVCNTKLQRIQRSRKVQLIKGKKN